jgi:virginiamycin B lyase
MTLGCEQFANDAVTTLSVAVTLTDTTITVTSASGFPTYPFRIMIDNEIMMVTLVVGLVFTVTRGIEETTIETHDINTTVGQVLTNGGLCAFSECRFATGTRANLPSPELEGRLYLTQSPGWYLFRENGAAWRAWGPIFQLSEGLDPQNSIWSWINEDDGVNPNPGLTNLFGDLVFSVAPNVGAGENVRLFTENVNASTPYPLESSEPYDICSGPDGNLWVTDLEGFVWKVTTGGVATAYALSGAEPYGIASGPDGNLWVADLNGFVWKVTTGGVGTAYPLVGATPYDICTNPDGNLWVTDTNGKVWKVTTGGAGTSYTLTASEPQGICTGFDNNLWVADLNGFVWKVTTGGVGTSYALTNSSPEDICSGSDNNLWVTDMNGFVWKVTTGGATTSYTLSGAEPYDIASGADSNLWATDLNGFLWKITTGGTPTKYNTIAGSEPYGICNGPDSNLWIADAVGFVWKATNTQAFVPYTVTVAFTPFLSPVDQTYCGVVFRDSATDKFVFYKIMYDTTSITKRDLVISLDKYTNSTSLSANYKTLSAGTLVSPMVWFKINDDGANLNWYFSNDGFNFMLFDSHTRTDFLANPDEVGIAFGTNNATGGAGMNLHSWLKV